MRTMTPRALFFSATALVSLLCATLTSGSFAAASASPIRVMRPLPVPAWNQFQGDPALTGNNPFEYTINPGNVAHLKMAWSTPSDGLLASSSPQPVVANGVVYVAVNAYLPGTNPPPDNKLYAFPAKGCSSTCQPLWTASFVDGSIGSPAIMGGVLYVTTKDGKLYAFPTQGCSGTCKPLWSFATGSAIYYSPTAANGIIYFGTESGYLYAISGVGCGKAICELTATTHTVHMLWRSPLSSVSNPTDVTSPPAVADGIVFATFGWRTLAAFSANGCGQTVCKPLWTGPKTSSDYMTVYDHMVYMTGAMHLYAFNESGCGHAVCQPLWSGNLLYPYTQQPAVANGVIYATAMDGNGNHGAFFAFPVRGCKTTCQPLWQGTLDVAYSFPTIANGVIYVGTINSGKLVAYPAAGCHKTTCAPLWTYALPGETPYFQPVVTTPTIMDGTVYLTTSYLAFCAFHF